MEVFEKSRKKKKVDQREAPNVLEIQYRKIGFASSPLPLPVCEAQAFAVQGQNLIKKTHARPAPC